MVSCAVAKCRNSSAKSAKCKDGITFHRFPRDEKRRKTWEIAMNRDPQWAPTDCSTVCSLHFEVKDFYFTEGGLRRLSTEAVPTINTVVCEEQEPLMQDIDPIEINPTDTEEVVKLKHRIRRLEDIANNRKKRINLISQAKKRMQKKMDQMKAVIEHLVQGPNKGPGT